MWCSPAVNKSWSACRTAPRRLMYAQQSTCDQVNAALEAHSILCGHVYTIIPVALPHYRNEREVSPSRSLQKTSAESLVGAAYLYPQRARDEFKHLFIADFRTNNSARRKSIEFKKKKCEPLDDRWKLPHTALPGVRSTHERLCFVYAPIWQETSREYSP